MNLIVLAGDRGPDDPLARQAGVAGKTLVPVAGVPMLTRVLATLARWPRTDRIVLVAPRNAAFDRAIEAASVSQPLSVIAPKASPSTSVAAALEALGGARPVTLVTADHPLLKCAWLDALSVSGDEDLRVGLVDHAGVRVRFPESRRTRYRFADRELGGTNLFQFRTPAADAILELWQRVERERKKPWKIVSLLGVANLVRFAAGRLHSVQAFRALSERVGLRIDYRLIDDPLTAVDVDTPDDLRLVESLIREQEATCS